MEQLTKKQVIALEMLKSNYELVLNDEDQQTDAIVDALDFANRFLMISEMDQD